MEFGTAAATAPVAAYFRNPRRSTDVLSSAMGTSPRSLQFSISPRTSVLASWMADILHPAGPLSTGVLKLVFQNSFILSISEHYNGQNLMARRRHSRNERTFA